MLPLTSLGKVLAGMAMLIGIGVFALPTAIITAAILEADRDPAPNCRHCGKSSD